MEHPDQNRNRFFELAGKQLYDSLSEAETKEWQEFLSQEEFQKEWELMQSFSNAATDSPKQSFNTDIAWNKVTEKTTTPAKRKFNWYQMAAAITILIGLFFVFSDFTPEHDETPNPFIVQGNGIDTTFLPDGSFVILKKGSELAYFKETFNESDRNVSLTGTGYFDIEKKDGLSFKVNTSKTTVTVLGTAFYVNAEDLSPTVEVNVVHGLVEVAPKDKSVEAIKVAKGERALYNDESKVIEATELDYASIFWNTNTLVFKRTPLYQVIDILKVRFNQEIEIEEAIKDCRLTGTFNELTLEEILMIIESTFNITIENNDTIIKINGEAC